VRTESNTLTVKLFNFTSATQNLLRCISTGSIIKKNARENLNDLYDALVDNYLFGIRPEVKQFRTDILASIVDVTDDPRLDSEHTREVYE
jgi:hypothetical protein